MSYKKNDNVKKTNIKNALQEMLDDIKYDNVLTSDFDPYLQDITEKYKNKSFKCSNCGKPLSLSSTSGDGDTLDLSSKDLVDMLSLSAKHLVVVRDDGRIFKVLDYKEFIDTGELWDYHIIGCYDCDADFPFGLEELVIKRPKKKITKNVKRSRKTRTSRRS